MAEDMIDEEEVYTVIPTAPEDVTFESSLTKRSSPAPAKPSARSNPMTFTGRPSNGSSSHLTRTDHQGYQQKPSKEGKRKDGLPSHAFSRNYYCRFCPFNTTKSKVHLYHLIDVHGADHKIFSCDRCDYASRWKCKVIRHRKMIHKINEPKFEPEMHDSRSQTGKRPPPLPIPPESQQRVQSPQFSSDNRTTFPSQSYSTHNQPAFAQPYAQSAHPIGLPVNPFVNKTHSETTTPNMKKEERPNYTADEPNTKNAVQEPSSRRKQRKPQTVRKVIKEGDEEVYQTEKQEILEDINDNIEPGEVIPLQSNQGETKEQEPEPLSDLFGNMNDNSGNSSSVFAGASWRKRLMPTAVAVTTNKPAVQGSQSNTSTSEDRIVTKTSPISSLLKPALPQTPPSSGTKSPASNQYTPSNQSFEDSAIDDTSLIKDKCVEEMMIDDEPHYRCTECNFISKFRWKTSKHYKANHNSSKLFKCTVCEFTTPNRVEFFSHKATHSSRPEFRSPYGYFTHPMMVQGMHRCDECSYVASSKTNLDRHMVNHRLNNPVKCLYCSFSSTGEAAIQRHMAEHHDQSETPLALRQKYTSDMDDNSQDEGITNSESEHHCELCGYTARNWSKMKEHMIRHSEGTPFACSYCDSKYKRPADLNRHLKIKHNTCLADIGLDGPTLKGVMTPFQEGLMDPLISTDGLLHSLKRSYPTDNNNDGPDGGDSEADDPKRLCIDEEGANLQCSKCSYVAKWKSDLERHMKVHSEDKRYGCHVCYKSYKYQGDLNVHMRRAHAATHIRSPKQMSGSGVVNTSSTCKTPPPNVQVLSNEMIVNMSHAAIVNPLANLGPPTMSMSSMSGQDYPMPTLSAAPQMPALKPAPNISSGKKAGGKDGHTEKNVKYDADGKRIKKGELDPATMIHVPGGEFKCLNCCYETNFKSHLDAHMRLHPDKPFHCMFCNYASYWRGDTKKHIEKNHPDKLPSGINPYNLVEQVFEEAVRNSPNRHKPLPEVHNTVPKNAEKLDRGTIWTPPNEEPMDSTPATPSLTPAKTASPMTRSPKPKTTSEEGGSSGQIQCPHCNYTTSSESRLNAHMATHYNLKIFKCPVCGKRANWKWDIQKHMRQDHPGQPEEVICMDTEEARETLDEYLKDHPEQRGKPRVTMPTNFRPEHWPKPRDMTSSSKTTSIRPFRCSICGRRSNWKCDIRKHYRQVHPQRIDARVELMTKEELLEAGEKEDDVEQHYPEMKSKGGVSAFKPYRCSLCGKNSRWKWDVTKHIKMVHRGITDAHVIEDEDPDSINGSMPATPDTSITDTDAESAVAHSPTSSLKAKDRASPDPRATSKQANGPKIGCYQCSICSQFSEFMWVIRRHIRSLHPNQPDAKIVDLSGKGDEAAVSDSRPYICSLCGKRSNWKWDVKKHILSVHRGNIGSILDELLNKETVIYTDGKTMEVDGNAKEKIAAIQSHMKEEGIAAQGATSASTTSSVNNSCYSSLPTMVGLNSAIAPSPDPSSQGELSNGSAETSPSKNDNPTPIKFKCGYCFYASSSRNETVRHVRAEHAGKILRIQTLNRAGRDEQTTYKAAHRSSTSNAPCSMWQCSQCSFKNSKKEEALIHIQTHGLYNAYQCAICDFADDMEYTLHKHIKTIHENVESVEDVLLQNIAYVPCSEDANEASNGVTYSCHQCEMKTAWRSAIVRHIREKHVLEGGDINTMFTKLGTSSQSECGSPAEQSRRYNCTICPYRTDKVSMFNEHMERHSPRPDSDLKCQYCDYWVTASRFLHQHMKLHQQDNIATVNSMALNGEENSRDSVKSEKYVLTGGLAQCPDCPYRGKTKDLNAHRKLHKERPGAEFKCPECPYWVTHSRLLQQHAKVHSPHYRQRDFTGSLSLSDPSIEDVAAFKQHLISSQVNSVKLESGDCTDRLKRKLYQCSMCPFASNKQAKVDSHMELHGAMSDGALRCKFCDYYCDNRDLMAQHIKVHSLQYQGEIDDEDILSEKHKNSVSEEETEDNGEILESAAGFNVRLNENNHLTLEKQKRGLTSRKYCCEKCSYCTAWKENFRRHMNLHGSKQGHTCTYCDYSVPTSDLLKLHEDLHKQPNKNLLATQSIMNLTKLKPVAADIQLAQSADVVGGVVTDVHDHINLYENIGAEESENDANAYDEENDIEPEFIDLAELGSKVTQRSTEDEEDVDNDSDNEEISNHVMDDDNEDMEMEDGEEVWICRHCDRAFDSETELMSHEKLHSS